MLFTDTVTIYNHSDGDNGDLFIPHTVHNAQWRHSKDEITLNGNAATENKVESITFKDFAGYVEPVEYIALSDSAKANYWTLNPEAGDVVILGECSTSVTCGSDFDTIRESYQYVCTLLKVADNRNRDRLKCIKVIAR